MTKCFNTEAQRTRSVVIRQLCVSVFNPVSLRIAAYAAVSSVLVCSAHAGLGPENVAVIVNAASESSKKVAAEYAALRIIPASNLVELQDVPDSESTTVEEFREKLLKPVLKQLDERGLREQIDCIAWSSDFPTAINVKTDIGKTKTQRVFTPVGSINGLTFLHEAVLKKDTSGYLSLVSNGYFRRAAAWPVEKPLPVEVARQCAEAAQNAAKDGTWPQAANVLAAALEDSPGNSRLQLALAQCYVKLEKPDEAVGQLRQLEKARVSAARAIRRDSILKSLVTREDVREILSQMDENDIPLQPTLGFRNSDRWNPVTAIRTADETGRRYLLSTVLAVTRGRGTTVEEAIENLRRSVKADGTHPTGTFYFPVNGNVRSTCRDGEFTAAALKLRKLGHNAKVFSGVLPQKKDDVAGATIGTASFDWKKSGSTILPGAICEHLTSFGGIMRAGAGQTPLTEFLRHGAAGASGTVTEPFAIPHKFPSPFLHVHYVRGCSLAEAFYQSVFGPYQLLIVGDPLCQPWATFPEVTLTGIDSSQSLSGTVEFHATSKPEAKRFEVFIDGRLTQTGKPGQPLRLDSSALSAGNHEVRVVAVEASPIETRGRTIFTVTVPSAKTKPVPLPQQKQTHE